MYLLHKVPRAAFQSPKALCAQIELLSENQLRSENLFFFFFAKT